MSIISKKTKDKKYRLCYKKNEFNLIKFKFLNKQSNLFLLDKQVINFLFYKKLNLNFKIGNQFRNRCLVSNKARFVFTYFKLSRMFLKEFSLSGLIMGVKKASW